MLHYASRLKNREEHGVDHAAITLNVLRELGLTATIDTPVERCSGGERKRLALAAELTSFFYTKKVQNRCESLLIAVDEPTSGFLCYYFWPQRFYLFTTIIYF